MISIYRIQANINFDLLYWKNCKRALHTRCTLLLRRLWRHCAPDVVKIVILVIFALRHIYGNFGLRLFVFNLVCDRWTGKLTGKTRIAVH